MKIGREIYYKLHYSVLKYKIEKAKEDLHTFEIGYRGLRKIMFQLKPYIEKNVNIKFDELIINPPNIVQGRLAERFVHKEVLYTRSDFNYHYENYKNTHRRYNKHREFIKEMEGKIRSYELYTKIIKKFNLKLSREIVERQYCFDLGYGLGKIRVGRRVSKRKRVNWGATTKRKEEILSKGGVLYCKEDAKRAKEENRVYKGEKYQVYHPDENVWILHIYTQITSYKFQLIKSNISKSLRKILHDFKAKDSYTPKIFPLLQNYK